MQEQSLIRLEGIKKVFYTDEMETWALSDIHLNIDNGEYVAISGPSGCGKSTLLSIMGLLNSPTEGRYLLKGEDALTQKPAEQARLRNRHIGFIFQSFNLIGEMTVAENVALPLLYRADLKKGERRALVEDALEKVDMAHRRDHLPSQLSGGQQQRVAIARALSGAPEILLADEPTGNLDSRNAAMIMELLDTLHANGSTICMVTHDPRFTRHATREVMLLDGKVVDDRSITQMTARASAN